MTTSFSTLARPVVALTRPPAAISVLPTATLAVNDRAAFKGGTGDQVFDAGSYLETSFSPSKVGMFVPPIAYSCPATTARPAVFFAIGMSISWSGAVHAFVAGLKPQVLLSTSSGFVRPPDMYRTPLITPDVVPAWPGLNGLGVLTAHVFATGSYSQVWFETLSIVDVSKPPFR